MTFFVRNKFVKAKRKKSRCFAEKTNIGYKIGKIGMIFTLCS